MGYFRQARSLGLLLSILGFSGMGVIPALIPTPAAANPRSILSITTQDAQGTWDSEIQKIVVGTSQSTLISFSEIGETIQKVWLDNPSRVVVDFDGCLTNAASGSCSGGATIMRLRQLKEAIPFPPYAVTGTEQSTHLTVITLQGSERKVYQFQLVLKPGQPPYSLVRLIPSQPPAPAQLASISQEYQQTVLRQLSQGLAYAEAQKLLDKTHPEYSRLIQCIALMQRGTAFVEAMKQSGVSGKLIDRIRSYAIQ